jgi:hypothetical protein
VHTVTADDVAAKVILNQAHASALPVTDFEEVCPLLNANGVDCPTELSLTAASNTVVLNRSSALPTTGGTVVSKLLVGDGFLALGALLMVPGRRRRSRRR